MKGLQAFIRKYFGFSESETNGFIILIPTMLLVLFAPKLIKTILINQRAQSTLSNDSQLKIWLAEIDANLALVKEEEKLQFESFAFNPNTVSYDEMISLGFSEKTTSRIEKYRNAGGTFKSERDLMKIYGISKERVNALSSLIIIPKPKKKFQKKTYENEGPKYKKYKKKYYNFELNSVSEDSLVKIRGLGPVLSKRIVKFRNQLGGFNHIDQLKEVYGLDSSVLREISLNTTLDSLKITFIHINSDSLKYLSKHPYISYKLAKTILAYKNQHGTFQSINDIKKIKIVTDSLFVRLKPYLKLDNN